MWTQKNFSSYISILQRTKLSKNTRSNRKTVTGLIAKHQLRTAKNI